MNETFLVVGLGNPGNEYKMTPHNAGFMSVEKLAKLVDKKKELESKEIIELLKTTTRSFEEVKAFLKGDNPDEGNE